MVGRILYTLFIISFFTGCYSVEKSLVKAQQYTNVINWPNDYQPSDADFYIHNHIQINAKPEVVWRYLVEAEEWPKWYEGMHNVEITNSVSDELQGNTIFRFSTMGQDFEGTIREYTPNSRLAWETKNKDLGAYHAWAIVPNEAGCLLITDEVQKGKLARLQKVFLPNKLRKLHDKWLLGFKEKSENQ